MRQYFTNNPVHQMPQISGKCGFYRKPLLQLPCNCLYQPAFAGKSAYSLSWQRRNLLVISPQRCMEICLSLLPQLIMQVLAAITFIAKNPAAAIICKQRFGIADIMFVSRGKYKITNNAIVGYLKMKSIAKKCLAKPLSVCTSLLKLLCKSGSDKLAGLTMTLRCS